MALLTCIGKQDVWLLEENVDPFVKWSTATYYDDSHFRLSYFMQSSDKEISIPCKWNIHENCYKIQHCGGDAVN